MNKKHETVMAVFETRGQADRAVDELRGAGFPEDKIGVVARSPDSTSTRPDTLAADTYAEEGAVAGALAGVGVGGLVGLGVVAGAIPVIGPAIAAGTLGTILLNAAGGAAIGGITGALVGQGIPEEEARFYEDELKAGRYLVTVQANGRWDEAWTILQWHGGYCHRNPTADAANSRRSLSASSG